MNPCSRTAPCKTFAGAISKTAAHGEISVLDPGGYGSVIITKSITLSGEGTAASILAASTNGLVVNAGANDIVTIRNISINGAAVRADGAGTQINIDKANITNNATGVQTLNGATARLSNVFLSNNATAIMNEGTVISFGNNRFAGNTVQKSGGPLLYEKPE